MRNASTIGMLLSLIAVRAYADEPAAAIRSTGLDANYFQYGVSLVAETVLSAGAMCSGAEACILGSGGGISGRAGFRSRGAWYVGGVYEITKQETNNLYRLGTLQQLRAEFRYHFDTSYKVMPVMIASGGLFAYGNTWGVDTFGPVASLGVGVEVQVSRRTLLGLQFSYRGLLSSPFVDESGFARERGIVSLLGIEIVVEGRDPF
ncbi:MAG: hypothetical protein KBF88_04115 [Polyangiaceae bacterium]|nr:hypothetical protein [Polyangiaceae bacterium]